MTDKLRDDLFILASERHADTYLELADVVDGNAYYWSSVDPERFPGYREKLDEMSDAVIVMISCLVGGLVLWVMVRKKSDYCPP